ncbi:ricin-type beta-trefoil lectin domain protein [Streptomyces luteireticuli]|uniref:Ricin B lectin domain-containing protein n=1 Tax=Streptomyces luteireticuli TaxID=173858 RepID=A0ABP3IFB1_9ACTN
MKLSMAAKTAATIGVTVLAATGLSATSASAATASVTIVKMGAYKCIDVPGSNAYRGAPVTFHDCNKTDAQKWQLDNSTGELKNADGTMCIDAPGNNFQNGAHLQMWDCNGGKNQKWAWSSGQIVSQQKAANGKNMCWDALDGRTDNGTPVGLWECGPAPVAFSNQDFGMSLR